ncbi:DUF2726 domain-containing protein [Caldichromatium japonicum]|uniref:DUF2726 domain-containing protein n=1 Tax=Caldichromatium japonicum TaxID=2699430 RepID=A0A6G7VD07_9GAMM|nr:DUF2726 domain-containing protein [Caldichromatium japonicum]QIK37854.1 DUF2726 domain-containing protein [Caldichromatium japonicum]
MAHLYALLGLGALVVLALVFDLAQALGWRRREPYVFDPHWLTPRERILLAMLEHVLGDGYRVFVRVRASEVLAPAPGLSRREQARILARLERQRFDYLICKRDTLVVRAAIKRISPPRWRKTLPPDELEPLCKRVRLPLLRLIERPHYVLAELAAELEQLLQADRWVEPTPVQPLSKDQDGLPADRDELAALADLAQAIKAQRATDPAEG